VGDVSTVGSYAHDVTAKSTGQVTLPVRNLGVVVVALAVLSGIVRLLSLGRKRTALTAAEILQMNDKQFGQFLSSTGLDAKVEAVTARRRAAR
jgi:hypothetical protein